MRTNFCTYIFATLHQVRTSLVSRSPWMSATSTGFCREYCVDAYVQQCTLFSWEADDILDLHDNLSHDLDPPGYPPLVIQSVPHSICTVGIKEGSNTASFGFIVHRRSVHRTCRRPRTRSCRRTSRCGPVLRRKTICRHGCRPLMRTGGLPPLELFHWKRK